jgi:hypothetical protein
MSVTSYAALFRDRNDGGLGLFGIQIPMIQRDYAQGRDDPKATRIRREFIARLTAAITPNATGELTPIGLDFIYGDVRKGVFHPLDGQQRLTALFLLHWYLAVRSGGTDEPWLNFAYETRDSARLFCEELHKAASLSVPVECKTDFDGQRPAEWIKDQSWFMPGWKSEPTISSMLVVLDYIHMLMAEFDAASALACLTDRDQPAIHFHILNLADMGLDNDIYVRMNSRGKPLTDFEIFKARFGAKLERFSPKRAHEFAQLIDGSWSDIFWAALARGTGDRPTASEVDASILRYMRYLADFANAREGGRIAEGDGEADVCLRVFGDGASDARLDWLFRAFNLWSHVEISSWFAEFFRDPRDGAIEADPRLPVFDPGQYGANLFLACCKYYSPERHKTEFPTRLALLLHAVLISECATDAATMKRLRIVRNLVDWSVDEIRTENMSRLIEQTNRIMSGYLPETTGFNVAQMEDERRKAEFLSQSPHLEPALHALEDHDLLRGRLLAFSLEPETLATHADAFARAFGDEMDHNGMAAALLAADDYTDRGYVVRRLVPARQHDRRWREVMTGTLPRSTESAVAKALHAVLTCVSGTNGTPNEALNGSLVQPFLIERTSVDWFDWRFYFVAYPAMRDSAQGCYSPAKVDGVVRMGYVMRRHHNVDRAYRDADPYLHAVCARVGEEMSNRLTLEQTERVDSGQWLRLTDTGITIASRQDGWRVYLPAAYSTDIDAQSVFETFGVEQCVNQFDALEASVGTFWLLPIAQAETVPDGIDPPRPRDVTFVDRKDRVSYAADFILALLEATADDGAGGGGGGGDEEDEIPSPEPLPCN